MHTGGGNPTLRTLAIAWIIVRALDTMSSMSTGWRSARAAVSGRLTSTSLSPRRIFCNTVNGAPAKRATSWTHCSLSASGPINTGRSTWAATQAAMAGADWTTRVGTR